MESPRKDISPSRSADSKDNRRQRDVFATAIVAALIGLFFLLYGAATYQIDFWHHYFFHDSVDAGERCTAAASIGSLDPFPDRLLQTLPHQALRLPHSVESLFPKGIPAGSAARVLYECDVRPVSPQQGILNLHFGWIYGDRVLVEINGKERAYFAGNDKLVLPLGREDFQAGALHVSVWVVSSTDSLLGFTGNAPIVLTAGNQKNSKVFGLEVALQQIRQLFNILPAITMGLFLIIGWFLGNRSRLLVVTLFYFLMVVCRNLINYFVDFWPWDIETNRGLFQILGCTVEWSLLIFAMQMLGVGSRYVRQALACCLAITFLELLATLSAQLAFNTSQTFFEINKWVYFIGATALLARYLARRQGANTNGHGRINWAFLGTFTLSFLLSALDYGSLKLGSPLRLSAKVDVFMPFFIGGVVLYTLTLIERRYHAERERRAQMEGDLAIAAKLQGIITPSELEGRNGPWSYAIDSKSYGALSGDWVKVQAGAERSLFVMGDVVGKGPSAALTHSGIAAIWDSQIKSWERGVTSSADILSALNSTMFGLFKGQMNTTFAAAELCKDGSASVASCGNFWLHLGKEKCTLIPPTSRALLGMKPDLTVTFAKVDLALGDWLVCFTDGVVEGHRPIKKFFAAVEGNIEALTALSIREQLTALGAETVQPDDASILILRHEAKVSQAVA